MALAGLVALIVPFLLDVLKLSIWFVLLALFFVIVERLWALHPQKILRRSIGVDIAYYYLNSLLTNVLLAIPLAVIGWCLHRVVPDRAGQG